MADDMFGLSEGRKDFESARRKNVPHAHKGLGDDLETPSPIPPKDEGNPEISKWRHVRVINKRVLTWAIVAVSVFLFCFAVALIVFLTSTTDDLRNPAKIVTIVFAVFSALSAVLICLSVYYDFHLAKKLLHLETLDHVKELDEKGLLEEKSQPILKVRHLKQFFKLGPGLKTKAVNNVSFDLAYGEVLGLVGESGCGKTTTGRSIIKLYDITGGEVIFKDQVISAGTRWNEKEIKYQRIHAKEKIDALKVEMNHEIDEAGDSEADTIKAHYQEKIDKINEDAQKVIDYQKVRLRQHRYDNAYGAKEYPKKRAAFLEAELEYRLSKLPEGSDEAKSLKEEYAKKIDEAKHTKLMSKMQMIFQDPISSLNPRMTVYDTIAEGLKIQGIKDKEVIDEKVFGVLKRVGLLPEHATRYPHEFSGGQRQRIGIARAVVMNPELIIADEPVSALDVSIQAQVINLLNELRQEMGLSIIFVAHDLSVVKYFCDRIAVMYFGKMVELTTSEELFRHPLHPYTKSLISAIPLPDPHYEAHRVRIIYNPAISHDYSKEKPTLREILPGHFVNCNSAEFEAYKKEIEELDKKKE